MAQDTAHAGTTQQGNAAVTAHDGGLMHVQID